MTRYGSFSFPDDFIYTWKKFQSISKREGKSASEILRNFVFEYVDIHDPGNPQLRITSFSDDGVKTIEQLVGRIRQRCLEYAQRHPNNEIKLKIVNELIRESKIPKNKIEPIRDRIVTWLHNHGVKVWR